MWSEKTRSVWEEDPYPSVISLAGTQGVWLKLAGLEGLVSSAGVADPFPLVASGCGDRNNAVAFTGNSATGNGGGLYVNGAVINLNKGWVEWWYDATLL